MSVDHIIDLLRRFTAPNVFNPWANVDALDILDPLDGRRLRLRQHFNCQPRFLLIGEAPGYQGCHFSGVPFTNEKLLMDGCIPRIGLQGRITTRRLPWSEPAATIMWRTLHKLDIAETTVCWNSFAFHPHKPGNPYSNRAPTNLELQAGKHVLSAVLDHFSGARVIAVGRVAERALTLLSVPHEAVRHPSMGGATEFAVGMRRLCLEVV